VGNEQRKSSDGFVEAAWSKLGKVMRQVIGLVENLYENVLPRCHCK
jgi:hypothetical protein